jgi:hypothetical protein
VTIDKSSLRLSAERCITQNAPGGDGNPHPALAVRAADILSLLDEITLLSKQNANLREDRDGLLERGAHAL